MDYIRTPVDYVEKTFFSQTLHRQITETVEPLAFRRDLHDVVAMLDNLVELVVFTPRGDLAADPDFGFEYWGHEYSNVSHRDFNNGQPCSIDNEITRQRCQQSVTQSLMTYAPMLLDVNTTIELDVPYAHSRYKKINSKYMVNIIVTGRIKDGMDRVDYRKVVTFMVEPTVKSHL